MNIIIAIALLLIGGVFAGQKEILVMVRRYEHNKNSKAYKKWVSKLWFPNWSWYRDNHWDVGWLKKYVFSILKDGYHFTGEMGFLLALFAQPLLTNYVMGLTGLDIIWSAFVSMIISKFIFGLGANISYHIK